MLLYLLNLISIIAWKKTQEQESRAEKGRKAGASYVP